MECCHIFIYLLCKMQKIKYEDDKREKKKWILRFSVFYEVYTIYSLCSIWFNQLWLICHFSKKKFFNFILLKWTVCFETIYFENVPNILNLLFFFFLPYCHNEWVFSESQKHTLKNYDNKKDLLFARKCFMELAWKSFKKFYFFKKNLINKMLLYGKYDF